MNNRAIGIGRESMKTLLSVLVYLLGLLHACCQALHDVMWCICNTKLWQRNAECFVAGLQRTAVLCRLLQCECIWLLQSFATWGYLYQYWQCHELCSHCFNGFLYNMFEPWRWQHCGSFGCVPHWIKAVFNCVWKLRVGLLFLSRHSWYGLSASCESKRGLSRVTPGLCQEQTLRYSHYANFFSELAVDALLPI